MRTYLVVIDETEEAKKALLFASRRAVKTGGGLIILALEPPSSFFAFGSAQATMEDEARARAEALVNSAAGTIFEESGIRPSITVRKGKGADVVRELIEENHDIAALVLATAASGAPGPLVSHFTGQNAGKLACPVMIIPGSLTAEKIENLS